MSILHEIIAQKENADDVLLVGTIYFKDKDKIVKNDELLDLETSKTIIALDSPVDGYVEYLVEKGHSVNVGEIILRIHDEPDAIISEKPSVSKTLSGLESVFPLWKYFLNQICFN